MGSFLCVNLIPKAWDFGIRQFVNSSSKACALSEVKLLCLFIRLDVILDKCREVARWEGEGNGITILLKG